MTLDVPNDPTAWIEQHAMDDSGPAPEAPTEPSADAAPTTEPAAPPPLSDDLILEIKVDGQPQRVTLKELKDMGMRHADYTRKTMELAEQRRQFQQERQQLETAKPQLQQMVQEYGQLKALVTDPNKLLQLAQYYQAQSAQSAQAPDEVLTLQQARSLVMDEVAQARQQLQQEWTERQTQLEVEQLSVKHRAELDKTIDALVEQHPILGDLDLDIGKTLRREALDFHPQTLDDAKRVVLQLAQARVEKAEQALTKRQKAGAVQAAALKKGIEPPGGVGVPSTPKKYDLFTSKDLASDVARYLEQ